MTHFWSQPQVAIWGTALFWHFVYAASLSLESCWYALGQGCQTSGPWYNYIRPARFWLICILMARLYVGAEYLALLRQGSYFILMGHHAANNMQTDRDHTIMWNNKAGQMFWTHQVVVVQARYTECRKKWRNERISVISETSKLSAEFIKLGGAKVIPA